ncbi:hypothetical protein BU25DRAFT_104094 [Macroventuria anomochaeta]|uniref:Uncharacterized protein n=1 Tax=Macroventuria anomochaeta TaxID=301207 RepID=A0ACB6RW99_9PLEO|nr:uncharacterized protein BU25DRAFT_104094 [Macroventuria anomochaeta]KAF2626250.1 hypothetical protein BU25DRAFT_104094 [Macroventuria anomochaeta]
MAQAALEDTMNSDLDTSVALIVARNDARNDAPWTTLARRNDGHDEDNLSRASSSATTSVGSSPTAVFSFREPSIVTKPTSYGTGYPTHDYKGEGKADTTYATSLSAKHGSGSEAEVEHDDALCTALLGAGAWSSGHQAEEQCLRRHENSKVRLSKVLPHRLKKLPLVLHQFNRDEASASQEAGPRANAAFTRIEEGTLLSTSDVLSKALQFARS